MPPQGSAHARPSKLRKAASGIGKGAAWVWQSSRAARVAIIVLAALLVLGVLDFAMNAGRIYPGVRIGSVDVSGMTVAEAAEAVDEAYAGRLETHEALIFANDEAASNLEDLSKVYAAEELSEQQTFEEAQHNKQLWTATAQLLGATLPSEALATDALAVGRSGFGAFERLGASIAGAEVPIRADYDGEQLEALAHDIDLAIGDPRVDFGMDVQDGTAHVTDGHDGQMVSRETLASELDRILLADEAEVGSFVAHAEFAPLRIDRDQAQATCDAVNALLTPGATFSYDGTDIHVATNDLGTWVGSYAAELPDGGYRLDPYLDDAKATPALVSLMNEEVRGEKVAVSFSKQGSDVIVSPHGEIAIPQLDEAIEALDARMFDEYRADGTFRSEPVYDVIDIKASLHDGPIPFDEALAYGVIGEISSYTTQYTATSATQNRNHNIHLAADLLNDSITPANGGEWSFNEVAGDYGEGANAGFLPAGVIIDGEYETSDAGGVCQVATTVFNAVYDAGYPVTQRQAHSLRMASYPDGRDAAVSYPELDLTWENDTDSDVLMRTSYTDTTVTVALYGINPGYVVSSEVGEWAEGDKYVVKYEEDESLPEGKAKVKTEGTDGSYIQVKRIVCDRDGNFLRDAVFTSNYLPINKIVVYGPGTDLAELHAEYDRED